MTLDSIPDRAEPTPEQLGTLWKHCATDAPDLLDLLFGGAA